MRKYKSIYIGQYGRLRLFGCHKWICRAVLTLLTVFCVVVNAEPQKPAVQAKAPVLIAEDVSLPAGAALRFEQDTYEQLRGRSRILLTGFPLSKGETVDLELEQFEITTPATIIVEVTAEGDKPVKHPEVALFKGRVSGQEDSDVVIGISPYGNNGYIRKGDFLYYLSPDRKAGKGGRTDIHTIAEQSEISTGGTLGQFECRAKPNPELVSVDTEIFDCMWETGPFPSSYPWRVAFAAVECDYAFYQHFGSDVGAALAYTLQLTGTSSHFFERDMNIKWYLSYIRIWTYPDIYLSGQDVFNLFMLYWQVNMDHINRDFAMLFSCRPGQWGLSLCPSLCDYDTGYTVNFGLQGWFPRPVQDLSADNWDLHVVPHEAGHTFGSHHTHCYKPAIDNCALEDADSGNQWCQDRTDFNDCVPGTLMSYCGGDNCGGYANELMSFHPRVVNCVREYVDDITNCLRQGINPVYTDWTNTGYEDGSMGNPFNTVTEAVEAVIPDGTVYIASGSYHEGFIANRPVMLLANGGVVYIGP